MKRRIVCVLFALLMLTLSACGKKKDTAAPTPLPTAPPAVTPTPTPTPENDDALTVLPNPIWTPAPTPNPTPSPTPAAIWTPAPSSTPMPLSTMAPSSTPGPVPLSNPNAPAITKQPNGEAHFVGESAVFTVAADNWSTLHWTAVSPSGREISMKRFLETFPDASVLGQDDTTLTITNLSRDMSGWSFFCTFEKNGVETKTNSARLKVTDNNSTGGSSGSGSKSRRLRCPHCGSEVPRDLLDCPFCGGAIYDSNELGSVTQDDNGDIFYYDNTGAMYYDNMERRSTYVDTNSNYAIFNDGGLVHYGNYDKEEKKAREEAGVAAMLVGDPTLMLDNYWEQINSPEE